MDPSTARPGSEVNVLVEDVHPDPGLRLLMRTILVLYLKNVLNYDDDNATIIYHIFIMICFFTPVIGAIISDTLLGKFRTLSMVGLLLIAMGHGGIKPSVTAFGGDQFVIPGHEKQLTQFFSAFYFSVNGGFLISTFLAPILREDVHCFGDKSCFPLAFGVSAAFLIAALMIFLLGKPLYKIVPPKGHVLVQVLGCIKHALGRKWTSGNDPKKDHWLDYADDKFSKKMIRHTKILLGVLFLYIPLPVFWALLEQQGSRWTLQATRMNRELGSITVKPDQIQLVHPLLVLILIPIFQFCIYPGLAKFGLLTKSIPRMFVGGVLAGVAFAVSGLIELEIEKTYPKKPPPDQVRFQVINGLNCSLSITSEGGLLHTEGSFIPPFSSMNFDDRSVEGNRNHTFIASDCMGGAFSLPGDTREDETLEGVWGGDVVTLLVGVRQDASRKLAIARMPFDDIEKGERGFPKVRVLFNTPDDFWRNTTVKFKSDEDLELELANGPINATDYGEVEVDSNMLCIQKLESCEDVGVFEGKFGATYNVLIQRDRIGNETVSYEREESLTEDSSHCGIWQYEVTPPNNISMLLQIPQYVIITIGEILYSITGVEFSYQQAPKSMKAVVTSAWYLTNTFGNLIDIFIVAIKFFDSQAYEFFLFAAIMGVAMAVFATMGYFYESVDDPDADEQESHEMLENEMALEVLGDD
ncbi:unnamed protein product [Darwinula stevensoni]|uniref:Peptide transporter 1 n=1 Tax=Darwinula stevensoni TaxID=69355 RepID=A0A7R9AD22_9CRUS|nr:unnamed protein product [Darwinula stevensoni]CAG0900629.1 unnamed protein product [Darwinula stevensoni]